MQAPLADEMQLMRDVYLDGGWRLQLVETSEMSGSHTPVAARMFDPQGQLLFDATIGVPSGVAIDSDEVVRSAIAHLCVSPGDTDAEHFASYTRRQMAFAQGPAEHIALLYTLPEDQFELVEWDQRPGAGGPSL
jgi:hypothetical protein